MRGAAKGLQAGIKQLNPAALFVHCYAHSLNRALVNAACDTSNLEVRNLFGLVELIFTFVQGSPARHAYFLEQQKQLSPHADAFHLKGLSETRWNCRAAALRRLSTERVFRAVTATVEHVSLTTTDGTVRGTAAGLLNSITSFKFILYLQLLTPVMEAVNNVSETLQSPSSDILSAQSQMAALTAELSRLRSDHSYEAAFTQAESLAQQLDIECQLPVERQRKLPRRLDASVSVPAAAFSPSDQVKINLYFAVLDRLLAEVKERFPQELTDYAFLEPRHRNAIDAEVHVRRLATVYGLDDAAAASQWRLSHHLVPSSASIVEAYRLIPLSYTELRRLYQILLTLPVTTASVERSFSKLSLVKTKLRSTMGQERLEALLLASVEKDILLQLDNAELVARFAGKNDRRMLLS